MGNIGINLVLLQSIFYYGSCSIFMHEPSKILIKPSHGGSKSEFGFAMDFQTGDHPKLVIGAPRDTHVGKVFSYSMEGSLQDVAGSSVSTDSLNIDLENMMNTAKNQFPNQNYHFGGSVVGTKDYFMACAPLVTSEITVLEETPSLPTLIRPGSRIPDIYGSCIVYTNSAYQYNGSAEQYKQKIVHTLDTLRGGTGWSTLVDEVNELLIIMKTGLIGDITFVPLRDPLKGTSSVMSNGPTKQIKDIINENTNIGFGLTSGHFFTNDTICYAFSVQTREMQGAIAFLTYDKLKNKLLPLLRPNRKKVAMITDSKVAAMFGTALSTADLNRDGFSDMLIGAPTHIDRPEESETGAVHIFIGGDLEAIDSMDKRRTILGTKDFARFGTALATSDIDGDGLPEIFIGAPHEDSGKGAVYVLSGLEVNDKLLQYKLFRKVSISDLTKTQIIKSKEQNKFGFSLLVIPDRDSNGCNELAVGAPGSSAVVLYRCIPTIKVAVSTKLMGDPIVKETASYCTIEVCVNVINLRKDKNVYSHLVVTTDVGIGDKAKTETPEYFIEIEPKREHYCNNVTVTFSDTGPGTYTFRAQVKISNNMTNNVLENKNFNNSWVILSPQSKTEDTKTIVRNCGDDCRPLWNITLSWTGNKDTYDLGSDSPVSVSATVRNDGSNSVGSCLLFHVAGADTPNVANYKCIKHKDAIKCDLTRTFIRNFQEVITIDLSMNHGTNLDKELFVDVKLYENCDQPEFDNNENFATTDPLRVPYNLLTNRVRVEGIESTKWFTDQDLLDLEHNIIHDDHEYTIDNSGSVAWHHISVALVVPKQPFLQDVYVPITGKDYCIKEDAESFYNFNCTFDLNAGKTRTIMVAMEITKHKLMDHVVDNKFTTSSNLMLRLQPTEDVKNASSTTVFVFKKELKLINDITMIIILATLVAIVVLTILVLILYKLKFFIRKEKKNLKVLRESVRRHSIKKSVSSSKRIHSAADSVADSAIMNIKSEEDPFDEPTIPEPSTEKANTADDSHISTTEKADVHC